jgi:hypothetical protein
VSSKPLVIVLSIVGVVLLIAALNVADLLLARGARPHEVMMAAQQLQVIIETSLLPGLT